MRFITTVFSLMLATATFAQLKGDGYYRVKNQYTNRYMYLVDNRGSVDITSASADLGSIVPWAGYEKALTDPATIIYIKQITDGYDLMAQGVTSYGIISYPIKIMEARPQDGTYWCYATKGGMSVYLADKYLDLNSEQGVTATVNASFDPQAARRWHILPLNAETDNYFAVKPTIEVAGKYYKALYVGFPIRLKSPGMKAYKVIKHNEGYAAMEEIKENVIPAGTPIIVECTSVEPVNNKIEFITGDYTVTQPNLLKGVYFRNGEKRPDDYIHKNVTAYDAKTMRVLGKTTDGKLGFVTSTDKFVDANTAYLALKTESNAELVIVTPEEYDKLESFDPAYEEKLNQAVQQLQNAQSEATALQSCITEKYGALEAFLAAAILNISYDPSDLVSVTAATVQFEKLIADYSKYFNDAKTLTAKIKDLATIAETTSYSGKAAFLAAIAEATAVEQASNTNVANVNSPEAYNEACKALDQAYAIYLATGDEDARLLAEAVTVKNESKNECENLLQQIENSYGALAAFFQKGLSAINIDETDIASLNAATNMYKALLQEYQNYFDAAKRLTSTIILMENYADETRYSGLAEFLNAIDDAYDVALARANNPLVQSPDAYSAALDMLLAARETYDKTKGNGINAVIADTKSGAVYTLFGAKVRNGLSVEGLPAGIYVVNGKKVLVK